MDKLAHFPSELPDQHFPGGFTIRDQANAIVAWALRNGPLDDLHPGKYSELLKAGSLSRIADAEMKEPMISACERVETLLRLKDSDLKESERLIIGVTTVGEVRLAGGDVIRTSGKSPNHATLTGLTPEQASELLTPTIRNPSRRSQAMAKPIFYADFDNADSRGRLRLNCIGTTQDLARLGIRLQEDLEITLHDEELQAEGKVQYSVEERIWVARVDWKAIHQTT